MKMKNKEIELALLNILTFKEGQEFGGLLTEDLPLSNKRFLQRIRKELLGLGEKFSEEIGVINQAIYKKAIASLDSNITKEEGEDSLYMIELKKALNSLEKERVEELTLLSEEEVELSSPPAALEPILKIVSKFNYDFDIIEKFAK